MATTSPVKIPVTADPTRALKAFSAVQRSMAKLAPIAAKTAVRVTKIGVAFGATATAATTALTKMSMESIDTLVTAQSASKTREYSQNNKLALKSLQLFSLPAFHLFQAEVTADA